MTSNCLKGKVVLEHYGAGKQLYDVGLIGAGDMTVEAAFTKLSYLLELDIPTKKVKELFLKNMRGERKDETQTTLLY